MLLFRKNINLIAALLLFCSIFATVERSHALGSKPRPQPSSLYYPDATVTWHCGGIMGATGPSEGSANVRFDPNRGFYASDDYTGINLGNRLDGSQLILVTHFSRKSSSEIKIERLDAILIGLIGPSNQIVYSTENFTVANGETVAAPAASYALSVIDATAFVSCSLTFAVAAPSSSAPLNR